MHWFYIQWKIIAHENTMAKCQVIKKIKEHCSLRRSIVKNWIKGRVDLVTTLGNISIVYTLIG